MAGPMQQSKNAVLSQAAYDRYAALDQSNRVVVTYVWVDTFGGGEQARSKSRVLDFEPQTIDQVPLWATPTPSNPRNLHDVVFEDVLHPVRIYRDPFLRDPNKLVLCEVRNLEGKPSRGNNRASCLEAMEKAKSQEPWFGIEQEYFMVDVDRQMLGWPKQGNPDPMGPAHCGVGAGRVVGRHVVDSHLRACLYAGVGIEGTNAEVVPAQWEYQIGICRGIDAADHVWMARYLLERVAEDFGIIVTIKPRPLSSDEWMGSGAHCNFSTKDMRVEGQGLKAMEEAIEKLKNRHAQHMAKYDPTCGAANRLRLESAFDTFTHGVSDRGASVRIPGGCHLKGSGYIEDRRPAANADPYLVTEMLVRTVCLGE